jgi:hypothetical protein
MSNSNDNNRASRFDVWINWELIAEMHGWTGSIEDFKKIPIEELPRMRRAAIKGNR